MEQEIEKIMLRTFAGEASTEDIVNLSEWLALQEENKTTFQTVGAYWHASVSTTIPLHDKERTYEQLLKRVRASKRRLELTAWLRYAGVAAIVLVLTGAAYYYMSRADESIEQHYSLLTGASISSFQLPDGTDVTLNANSTLRYSDSFGERQRDVQLQGEAFFRVPKDINREFVVHLNEEMRIVVLGTTFNVRFDSTANNLSATLVEGSVRFETSDQAVVLTPNQQLLYNLADREISVITMEVEQAIAWKDRLLKYKSIPFSEAIALIEKQYKVEIQLADQTLGNQRISGTFDNDLSVEQILDMMKKSLSFDWKKEDGKYVVIK